MSEQRSASDFTPEDHARSMVDYIRAGTEAAYALGNRGPLKLTASGQLEAHILDAYWQHGFYVFEQVIGPEELSELREDVDRVLASAPIAPEADVDAEGRPALGKGFRKPPFRFAKPLSDPLGGTDLNNGRHPVKMVSPAATETGKAWTVQMLDGNLHLMDSALRLYGHPGLLAVAEAVNGPDFVPYNEVAFIKEAGLGPSVAWHQDGTTHWEAPDWDQGAHGFNFMTQLYPSTAGNAVWVLPGSHKMGRVDIRNLASESGSDRIDGAVPMLCGAGDVMIMNRQMMHGSFANSSPDRRVTLNAGFFPRKRVLDVTARRLTGQVETYSADRIARRSRLIALGIDARRQRFPEEVSYCYKPLKGLEEENRWSEGTRQSILKNYNMDDMFI